MVSSFVYLGLASSLLQLSSAAELADLKINNRDDIVKSAGLLASDVVDFYNDLTSNDNPGRVSTDDYPYWESGALLTALVDYWHLTGDKKHNDLVAKGLTHQASQDNFLPKNLLPSYLANDDQCMWALSAMLAAEDGFPTTSGKDSQWFDIAKSVYDEQKARLDEEGDFECGGGLRSGLSASHHGWDFKDGASNACLFNLAARLARYTGEDKYAETADSLWDWMTGVGIIDTKMWKIGAGGSIRDNCTTQSELQYSLPAALLTHGAAFMFNQTDSEPWRERANQLTQSTMNNFFPGNSPFEPECELHSLCDTSKQAYKGINTRLMAVASQLAPFTRKWVSELLQTTAEDAVAKCFMVEGKRHCFFDSFDAEWSDEYDTDEHDPRGLLQSINSLSAVSNLLIKDAAAPRIAPKEKSDEQEDSKDGKGGDEDEDNGDGEGSTDEDSKDGKDDDESSAPALFSNGLVSVAIVTMLVLAHL